MVTPDPEAPWVREQNALWRVLAGATIAGWEGLDEHIGGADDELTFLGQVDPFRQLFAVRALLGDGTSLDLGTYQNDLTFGLALRRREAPLTPADYLRRADVSDLPVGRVDRVEVHLDDRPWSDFDVIEVLLTVAGRSVLFIAAEIQHNSQGSIVFWAWESILLFIDPANAAGVEWRGQRQFLTRMIGPGTENGDVLDGSRRAVTRVEPATILKTRFPIARGRPGYRIGDVHALFDRVVATLHWYQYGDLGDGAVADRMTAQELRLAVLRPTKFRGCSQPEVDAMVRDVVATLEEFERR